VSPAETSTPLDSLSGTLSADFGKLLSAAQLFVNAYNNFQTSSADSLAAPFGVAFDNALLLALHAQTGAADGSSVIDSLAQIGINFQEASGLGSSGQFTIDLKALQAAFDLNPVQTAELLAKNLQALATIEAKLLSQPLALGLDLFASDINVPASAFDVATVTAQLSALSPSDAQLVNATLKKMMADEALLEGLGDTAIASSDISVANTSVSGVESRAGKATATVDAATNTQAAGIASGIAPDIAASVATFYAGQPVIANSAISLASTNPVGNSAALNYPEMISEDAARAQLATVSEAGQSVLPYGQNQNSLAASMGNAGLTGQSTATSVNKSGAYAPSAYAPSGTITAATGAAIRLSSGRVLPDGLAAEPLSASLMTSGAATSVGVATTAVPAALTSMNMPLTPLNPYLSAAVAAYRVNDAVASKPSYEFVDRSSETVPDVSAVPKIGSMNLDLRDDSHGSRSYQSGRSTVRTGTRSESEVSKDAPMVTGLDVSA
jgi:hypothetical protein